jgi:hypothetical protein
MAIISSASHRFWSACGELLNERLHSSLLRFYARTEEKICSMIILIHLSALPDRAFSS